MKLIYDSSDGTDLKFDGKKLSFKCGSVYHGDRHEFVIRPHGSPTRVRVKLTEHWLTIEEILPGEEEDTDA